MRKQVLDRTDAVADRKAGYVGREAAGLREGKDGSNWALNAFLRYICDPVISSREMLKISGEDKACARPLREWESKLYCGSIPELFGQYRVPM